MGRQIVRGSKRFPPGLSVSLRFRSITTFYTVSIAADIRGWSSPWNQYIGSPGIQSYFTISWTLSVSVFVNGIRIRLYLASSSSCSPRPFHSSSQQQAPYGKFHNDSIKTLSKQYSRNEFICPLISLYFINFNFDQDNP